MIEGQIIEAVRGGVRVDIEYIGEGYAGDYEPQDPADVPLLRFTVSQLWDEDRWWPLEDASYCTRVPADTPDEIVTRLAEVILDQVYDNVISGASIKKLCEDLSWITTADAV